MLEFFRQNQFAAGLLGGSVAAYLLGLFVTWLRREKKVLGYSVSSRTIAVTDLPDLSIAYRGTATPYLHSHSIVISNVGNRALRGFPVRIECAPDGYIYGSEISAPAGEAFEKVIEDPDYITINCGLLNVGESFTVGFTVLHTPNPEIRISARQENLTVRAISQSDLVGAIIEVLGIASPQVKFTSDLARAIQKKL